jgi:hypothetical protein
MFVFEGAPFALSAIAAPEETSLRSGIFDSLGSASDGPFAGFAGPGRRGGAGRSPAGAGNDGTTGAPQNPFAFFGQAPLDSGFVTDGTPLFTSLPGVGDFPGFGDMPLAFSPTPSGPFFGSPPLYQGIPGGTDNPGNPGTPTPPTETQPVPEPASWAMMIGGMMMMGGVLRLRSARRMKRAMA